MNTLPYELFSELTKGYFCNEWPTLEALNEKKCLHADDWFYLTFGCNLGDYSVLFDIGGDIMNAKADNQFIFSDTEVSYFISVCGVENSTGNHKFPEFMRDRLSQFMTPDTEDEVDDPIMDEDGNPTEYYCHLDEEDPVADMKRILRNLDSLLRDAAAI